MAQKFTTKKVKAYKILEDDWIVFGGKLYRVIDSGPIARRSNALRTTYGSPRFQNRTEWQLVLQHVSDPELFEAVTINLPSLAKVEIHNQKTKEKS